MKPPRVALFTDCFHDVNGVALTCRELQAFAERRRFPLLSVRAGKSAGAGKRGSVLELELERSQFALPVDAGLEFDVLLTRHLVLARRAAAAFGAELIHITSPGDFGILGALIAHQLNLPLVASWHTNLHEFAARRLERMLSRAPESWRRRAGACAEQFVLDRALWFYGLPRLLFAPNPELIEMLTLRTGRPVLPMRRGVDCRRFSPEHRRRADRAFVLGFSGRLRAEKNVRFLAEVERVLIERGHSNYRFLICGDGSEAAWLRAHLKRAAFPGFLRGEALAQAYANMDVFVFPSKTDTFGNVVQEALASGVPAVVTSGGGPKFIVRHGESGLVARNDDDFVQAVVALVENRVLHQRMRLGAREQALRESWDTVFESVWQGYRQAMAVPAARSHGICAAVYRAGGNANVTGL